MPHEKVKMKATRENKDEIGFKRFMVTRKQKE